MEGRRLARKLVRGGSAWSRWSVFSIASLFSAGSILSIGSAGSILSIRSAGRILGIGGRSLLPSQNARRR